MKKSSFIVSLLLSTLFFVGCNGFGVGGGNTPDVPGNDDDDNNTDQPTATDTVLLSPDAQKNLLVDIGEELLNTFNPADQKKAVELADDLYYKYKNYDWNAIGEVFGNEWENIYTSEFESFFGMPQRVIKTINGQQRASFQDLEIVLTLSKFGRVIEFDDKNKTVKISKNNEAAIVAKFADSDGTKCELKVWGEGKEKDASYTYTAYHYEYTYNEYGEIVNWNRVEDGERTIRVKIPSTIKMYLKHGSSSLIAYTFKWDSNLKDYINTSFDMQVINLGFQEETKISTTEASAVFAFTCNKKNVITAAVSLPKYKLLPWEGGSDITEEEGANWLEEYDEKYASLLGKLGKGEVKLNVMDKVQLKGGFTDGAALIDEYYNWEKKYRSGVNWSDYERSFEYTQVSRYWDSWYGEYVTSTYKGIGYYTAWWMMPEHLKEARQEQCNYLNKYAYLSMYYNNGTTEQAKLLMDTYATSGTYDPASGYRYPSSFDDGYDYYYTDLPSPITYDCYDIEPVMHFPEDETKVAVMTFFNSSKFLGLIDLVEDLANSYIALDKHNLIFPEDFEFDLN